MNTLVNLRSVKNEEINSVNEIELYLVKNQLVKKICRKHYKQPSPFDDKLLQLRQAAKDSTKHVNDRSVYGWARYKAVNQLCVLILRGKFNRYG